MTEIPKFYIVKRPAGNCEILPLAQLEQQNPTIIEKWGPYDSPEDAIARRIGLIRAGKCQPQWPKASRIQAPGFIRPEIKNLYPIKEPRIYPWGQSIWDFRFEILDLPHR